MTGYYDSNEKLKYLYKKNFSLKDDEDGHLVVLIIIEELMSKTKDEFLDHFARLGVFSKVQALMGSGQDSENGMDVIKSPLTETPITQVPAVVTTTTMTLSSASTSGQRCKCSSM